MWYRRFVSWIRSLFTTPDAPAMPAQDAETGWLEQRPTSPYSPPLRGQMAPFDQPPTIIAPRYEFPPFREPPTTVPLGRFTRPSEPIVGYPGGDNTSKPLHALWNEREPAPPSQPLRPASPSLPFAETPPSEDTSWMEAATEPNFFSRDADDGDEAPLAIEPGSDLYRRLLLLKRLVRQRVYNEGFPPNATPEQYHIGFGVDEDDGPPFNAYDE